MDKMTGDISPIIKIDGEVLFDKKIEGNIIIEEKSITNNISSTNTIDGNIFLEQTISGNISYGNGKESTIPIYRGSYEVTPLAFEKTTLYTDGRLMIADVVVKEVPYYETSNLSGGTTVYIAGQIDFE